MNESIIIIGACRNKISSDLSRYKNVLTLDTRWDESNGNYHDSTSLLTNACKISIGQATRWEIVDVSNGTMNEIASEIYNGISRIQYSGAAMHETAIGMAEQILENMPIIAKSPGINVLKNIFKGKPAIVVSAGPSLEKNFWMLDDYSDNVVIISIGQALTTLLANGITPDFVVGSDWTENNTFHYQYLCNSPLIASVAIHRSTLDIWPGPVYFSSSFFDYCKKDHKKTSFSICYNKGELKQNTTVAGMALSSADLMGCDPIILIGQDFALGENGLTHCAQSVNPGKWTETSDGIVMISQASPRQCTVPPKREIKHSQFKSMTVPNWHEDGSVKATQPMISWRLSFEDIVSKIDSNVINATEGGAFIKGTEHITLDLAIKMHCQNKISKACINNLPKSSDNKPNINKRLVADLKRMVIIGNVIKDGVRTADTLMRMSSRDNLNTISGLAKNSHILMKKLSYLCRSMPFMKMIYTVAVAKCQFVDSGKHNDQQTKIFYDSIERNRFVLSFVKKYNSILMESFKIAIKESSGGTVSMSERQWKYNHHSANSSTPVLSDSELFFEYGNYSIPILELMRGGQEGQRSLEILTKATNLRCSRISQFKKD